MKLETRYLLICALFALGEALGFAAYIFASLWPLCVLGALLIALFMHGLSFRFWWMLPTVLIGIVLSFITMEPRIAILRDISIQTHHAPFRQALRVESEPALRGTSAAGDRWVSFLSSYSNITLRVIAPIPATNDLPRLSETWSCVGWLDTRSLPIDIRPRRLWIKGRNTFARRIAPAPEHDMRRLMTELRHNFSQRMGIGLEHSAHDIASLNRAILLGERASLPSSIRDTFIRAGTMHVFAISGLHVMVVAQLLMVVLVCCAVPIRFVGFLLIPLLWAYTYLIGMTPSAIRAAGMASIYFAAYIFMRRPSSIVAWCLTFLIIHILDPLMLLNVGSELSFAVMLGILLSLRFCRYFNFGRWEGLVVTFAAWLAGTPIAAAVFGRITPGGILANIILIPTAAVSVVTSALGIMASFISTTLAIHINNIAALFTRAMVGISWSVAHLPGSNFEVSKWTFTTCLAWYAFFLGIPLIIIYIRRHHRRVL